VDISCRAQAAYPAPSRLTWDRRTAGGEGGQVTENQRGTSTLAIGRMLDIDLISEPPPPRPPPQMYVSKVWESVWPEGAGSD
jgi:hypothetical protein